MSDYLQISEGQQWDLMKMVIDRGDMKMLFKMLEKGYRPTPALIRALGVLHYGRELAKIADLYAEKYNLWPVFSEVFGFLKLKAFKQKLQIREKEKDERMISKLSKRFDRECQKSIMLTRFLVSLGNKLGRLGFLAEKFGTKELYDYLHNDLGINWNQLSLFDVFSDEFLIKQKNYQRVYSDLKNVNLENMAQYCQRILQYEGGLTALVEVSCDSDDLVKWLLTNKKEALPEFIAQKKWTQILVAGFLDFDIWKKWYTDEPYRSLRYVTGYGAFKLSAGRKQMFWFLARKGKIRDAFRAL